jgi:hypothetical protein
MKKASLLFLSLVVLLLSGCASLGIDTSTKLAGYDQTISNLETIYITPSFKDKNIAPGENSVEEKMKEINHAEFGKIVVLQANKMFASSEKGKSHTLVIKPFRAEMAASGWTAVRLIYSVSLIDSTSKTPVWQMETGLGAGGPLLGPLDEKKAISLLDGIKSKLIADKLISTN